MPLQWAVTSRPIGHFPFPAGDMCSLPLTAFI